MIDFILYEYIVPQLLRRAPDLDKTIDNIKYDHSPEVRILLIKRIILTTLLRHFIEPLTYAVIVIIGTAVLGRGVTNWYEHTLGIKAKKWLLNELQKTNTIVFQNDERNSQ